MEVKLRLLYEFLRLLKAGELWWWEEYSSIDKSWEYVIEIILERILFLYLPADGRQTKLIIYLLQEEVTGIEWESFIFIDYCAGVVRNKDFMIFGGSLFTLSFNVISSPCISIRNMIFFAYFRRTSKIFNYLCAPFPIPSYILYHMVSGIWGFTFHYAHLWYLHNT